MEGFAEAVKYFYEQWLLRDVLSYITPGAIVVTAIGLQYRTPEEIIGFLDGIPLLAYIPIFGTLFIVGFGLQNFGEWSRVVKWHDRGGDRHRDRVDEDRKQLECLKAFHDQTGTGKKGEVEGWLERTRERISVKKNMSGSAAVAISFSLLFFFMNWAGATETRIEPVAVELTLMELTVFIFFVVLIISLFRGHRHQRKLQKYWEDIIADCR